MAGGASGPSTPGTRMWAVITPSTPARTASRKGGSSRVSSRAESASMRGSSRWESRSVSPWPGKCFAVVSSPASWAPSTKAAARRPTRSGSSPKARVLMMGLSGSLLTSTTGAKVMWTPTARASRPVIRPASRANRSSSTAPSAMVGGSCVPPPSGRREGSA